MRATQDGEGSPELAAHEARQAETDAAPHDDEASRAGDHRHQEHCARRARPSQLDAPFVSCMHASTAHAESFKTSSYNTRQHERAWAGGQAEDHDVAHARAKGIHERADGDTREACACGQQ